MTAETALVTGGAGFVGAAVVAALLQQGDRVRVLVRRESDPRNLAGLDVETLAGDLRDAASVARCAKGCDVIYHVAALYSSNPAHELDLYAVNVEGTRHVLAAGRSARRIVHTSTIGTIGRPVRAGDLPTEETPFTDWERASHYVRSKVLGEQAALQAGARGEAPVVVVNPTAPVGRGDWRPSATGTRILAYLRGEMPSYLAGGINFCGVGDIGRGHLLAAAHGSVGRRYILGHPQGNLDLYGFLRIMQEASGRPPPRTRLSLAGVLDPRRWLRRNPDEAAGTRPLALTCDPTYAMQTLAWTPGPLLDAFREAVAWYRAAPP